MGFDVHISHEEGHELIVLPSFGRRRAQKPAIHVITTPMSRVEITSFVYSRGPPCGDVFTDLFLVNDPFLLGQASNANFQGQTICC